MGALAWGPPRLCRLLLPAGVFLLLLLLYLTSLRLQLPVSACMWGGRPCCWSGESPPEKGEEDKPLPVTPTDAALPPPSSSPNPWEKEGSQQKFQLERLRKAFGASITPHGEVLIGEYLRGWKELIKLMDSLGTAFRLISRETSSKITLMQDHHSGLHGPHYHTVQSMVTFELANGLVGFQFLPAGRPPSGCRTLLRLHRALKWLELFLHKLGTSGKDEEPSQMCASAYQEALAPYHSWWVRQAAALAFMALPSRRELLHTVCAEEEQKARSLLHATVRTLFDVYNITQEVYAAHLMLELP
ncbi:glycolipid transfer protein domain-containing protein 2 isoform X2 [Hemicordylus capensis]|uniref:glycolipid transfer protein domain-containing protein 2 isoform X2 n=1 Tax=Hemicordylus capensis TaxID=884348 RepID=UPI00230328CA|nr:glycolipid transfer protein domain-containing protein 2 isoform X2 [Hemicordylus capensis]